VLKFHFGLENGREQTLEEIGRRFPSLATESFKQKLMPCAS
jgi:DNA-directed RNA polymerase sigma subunit (sigma70/sigma32)